MSEQNNLATSLAPVPELYVSYESSQKLKPEDADLTSHDLTPRRNYNMELIMNGGHSCSSGGSMIGGKKYVR